MKTLAIVKMCLGIVGILTLCIIAYAQIGSYLLSKDYLYPKECVSVSVPEDMEVGF